uniref:DUF659 domain-containing protein n=1 Tax=Cajanus cajan TaxID=3821 RepID=A0A151R0D9_CAJCA|nr:hypothetical protein KK1_042915 [Cajanus cajan]
MSSNPIPSQSQTSSHSIKKIDIGWKHCHPTKENDTNEITCNYCKEKLKQISIRESCNKEATARVRQYIARFWYQVGPFFNMIKLESFHDMVVAIGFGCSIMSDAWTGKKQSCIINFLVNSSVVTMFVKSVDGSNFMKTEQKLFGLLDSIVEDIEEKNDVDQVITDNESNYVIAGKMIHQEKPNLRKMFVSDEWKSNKLSKEAKGREACKTVLMPSFRRNVMYILKVMAPLVKVLRLVDGRKIGNFRVATAMDKEKEVIMKFFNNNETKYKVMFEIVDRR